MEHVRISNSILDATKLRNLQKRVDQLQREIGFARFASLMALVVALALVLLNR